MSKSGMRSSGLFFAITVCLLLTQSLWAAHVNTPTIHPKPKSRKVTESQRTHRRMRHLAHGRTVPVKRVSVSTRRHRYHERFFMSSFVDDPVTQGDITAGEDPTVRQAAIDALGNMNGTVVA